MRDVNVHKLSNTDSWREAALHFKEFGCYTKLTPNPSPNSPYMKFWREETRRSIHGLHTGSDYIPGYFYFYLNYSPIMIAEAVEDETEEERKAKLEDDFAMDLVRADRIQDFPAVWDGDYDYFHYLEEAEARGEWAAVLKTRGRGYSFKGASMLNRNYHLIPRSVSYAIASEKEYLIRDGILSKAWANMSFLDQHTPWKKLRQVKKDMMHRRASYIANGIEKGYMSEIIGITMKDEPEKARGKRGKLILWEEAGKFSNLLKAWQIAKSSMKQGRNVYGLMAAFGTGGTEGAEFESLEKLFYKPKAYNIYAISNRWDADRAGTLSGYYHGEQTNREGFMDKNGNSDEEAAANQVRKERKIMEDEGIGRTEMLQEIAENSLSPAEAVLRTTGVYFPIADLKTHLATIESQPRKYIYSNYTGYLTFDVETDIIKWNNDDTYKPIRDFPLPKLEPGCIEIYEMPQLNSNRVIEFGRYIAGCDPIDRQKTTYTESLGSMYVFDRWTRRIVAEYTGRPENPKTFYENCRRLAMFYNCTILYENNLTGMFTYFEQKKSLHLLADTPANIRDNNNFTEGTNTSKGVPGSTNLNMKAREYSKSWLLDNIPGGNILCLQTIRSVALLKELIAWSHDGNFDRVSSLGMTLFYDNCLYREDSEEQGMNKKSLIEQDEYWKGWGLFEDEPNIAYDDSGSLIPLPSQRIYNDVQEQPFEFGM